MALTVETISHEDYDVHPSAQIIHKASEKTSLTAAELSAMSDHHGIAPSSLAKWGRSAKPTTSHLDFNSAASFEFTPKEIAITPEEQHALADTHGRAPVTPERAARKKALLEKSF